MTLLQLKYIVKIVECGSMNEASHALYVSQPALSSSVKELENELGIEIFTRSSQGIALTVDGAEFLTYARQVLDQADLLEERYKHAKPRKQLCQVSTQHYMFAVEAFVEMIDSIKSDEYEFTIRETRTKDIINQVANMLSEIGIIYLSDFNKDVIGKLLREMAKATIRMVTESVDAYVKCDTMLAEQVIAEDDTVDGYFTQVKERLIGKIAQDPADGEYALDLLMIAKYFERIGDHATNIAEWVIFSVTGVHKGE